MLLLRNRVDAAPQQKMLSRASLAAMARRTHLSRAAVRVPMRRRKRPCPVPARTLWTV